ncbi:GNAT family N-acetyltransferase [Deinococcus aquaticus]|uniref:GNAT family N-acetyltransferase n=1 Tax=Deinococcus aquaticus TaxID=328692 RepID=UPI003609A6A5
MIRPMLPTDVPDVLALLNWMDDAPEREVFSPDARDPRELQLECEDSTCLVDTDDEGVRAYCALSPFRDGLVLEGPVSDGGTSRPCCAARWSTPTGCPCTPSAPATTRPCATRWKRQDSRPCTPPTSTAGHWRC